jgi:hypothetical protein
VPPAAIPLRGARRGLRTSRPRSCRCRRQWTKWTKWTSASWTGKSTLHRKIYSMSLSCTDCSRRTSWWQGLNTKVGRRQYNFFIVLSARFKIYYRYLRVQNYSSAPQWLELWLQMTATHFYQIISTLVAQFYSTLLFFYSYLSSLFEQVDL